MKVKCSCGIEDTGRYQKLLKRGWKMFFLNDGYKVVKCKKCAPSTKDKIKTIIYKDYKPKMYHDIRVIISKLKTLEGLKSKEELREEKYKKMIKKRKHYHYQRNTHKKEGSKKYG